ncbi:MAG: DoxX family protein [Acidobacteriota bacterium]
MHTTTHTLTATAPARAWRWDNAIATEASTSQALLRVVLAAILLPHGAQHLLGLFGGYGFSGTLGWMTGTLGIAAPLAAVGIVTEFVAPLLMLAGLLARPAGLALAVFMAFAARTHVENGFFMNWFGALPAGQEGFEYHLLAIAIALTVAARGAGAFSVDGWLTGRAAR